VSVEAMRQLINEKTKFKFVDGCHAKSVDDAAELIESVYNNLNQSMTIDGMVIKNTQDHSLERFGSTTHHPKNAFAWKALQEEFVTTVRDVIWQMGKNKATPIAVVDAVNIDGTTVTHASLHNIDMIKKLGVKINAKVKIIKANQIIPQIVSVVEDGDIEIELSVCPSCGQPLKTINGQQFCTNDKCDERIAQNIAFLGRKNALDIPTLSVQTARKIVKAYHDQIQEMACPQNIIFSLKAEDVEKLDGFAEKSAKTLVDNIEKAKKVNFQTFIKALCLMNIGNDVGKRLAEKFKTIDAMKEASKDITAFEEELLSIPGIGPETAGIVSSKKFWVAANELEKHVEIVYETEEKAGNLSKKVFALTGKMEKTRSYYEELIKKNGGAVTNSVNKNTDYLVIQDVNSTSSKAKKARELGTKLISPEELEKMF
jgi:DNA ligase (NAD+)